jgi:hypothetical protein
MTRALTLADYPAKLVRVACRRCDRRWRHWRATLIALYGATAPLPDVLVHIARDCPKRGGIGNEACGAYYPDLVERSPGRPPTGVLRRRND